MLTLNHVSKIYQSKKCEDVYALNDITLQFPSTGLVFILGKSGCGKSTLLNLLGGIDMPTSGEMIFDGVSSKNFKQKDYDNHRNSYVGFVFQDYNLIANYSVGANIALALELQGDSGNRTLIEEALRKVELTDASGNTLYHRRVNELSGGQRQRVAVARAIVKNPKLILADEPTGALDSKTGEQLFQLLKTLSSDRLVIVVTHDRDNAERFGDRIIELSDGNIIGDSAPETNMRQTTEEESQSKRKRTGLPIRRAFLMGIGGLRHKILRWVSSIVLCCVAFSAVGFSIAMVEVNVRNVELNSMYDNNYSVVRLNGASKLDSDQLDLIRNYTGSSSVSYQVRSEQSGLPSMFDIDMDADQKVGIKTNAFDNIICWFHAYEIDPVTGEKDLNLKKDERFSDPSLCRLPQREKEVAITDLYANYILGYGYPGNDGLIPKSVDEIVGMKIRDYTIVGVYSTEISASEIERYNDPEYVARFEGEFEKNRFNSDADAIRNTIICACFVCAETVERGSSESILMKLKGDLQQDKEFLDCFDPESFILSTRFSLVINRAFDTFQRLVFQPVCIVAAVLIVFATMLTMNFLSVSIDARKRELGILRAMGASAGNITQICLWESGTLAAVNFIISTIIVSIACAAYNAMWKLSALSIWGFPMLSLFLLTFVVATVATIVPVRKIANKKPIDIINQP